MRPIQISQLKAGDRIGIINDSNLNLLFPSSNLSILKEKIKNGDFIGIREQDGSELFGTIVMIPTGPEVKFDLGQRYKLDLENNLIIGLLEPGDDGYNSPNAPMTPPTQVVKGAIVDMRPFNRNIDGVGTRIAINPNSISILKGNDIQLMLLGTVRTLEDDNESKVSFDKGQAFEDERYVDEKFYFVFDRDEDAKKVRPFDNDRDGVGSRVAVLGSNMPAGNDVGKMYYGTIKSVTPRGNKFFSLGIESDTKIVSGTNLGGLIEYASGLEGLSDEVVIIDGSATKNVDNSFFLKSIADVLLSTTSKTNLNRIEVVESALAENFGADGKEAIEYALESKESFNLFKEILEGLGQMEARRLGVSVKPKIETLTPPPTITKALRKKKAPVSAEPVEIITPDTSVFQNEEELSSILDEFLT